MTFLYDFTTHFLSCSASNLPNTDFIEAVLTDGAVRRILINLILLTCFYSVQVDVVAAAFVKPIQILQCTHQPMSEQRLEILATVTMKLQPTLPLGPS